MWQGEVKLANFGRTGPSAATTGRCNGVHNAARCGQPRIGRGVHALLHRVVRRQCEVLLERRLQTAASYLLACVRCTVHDGPFAAATCIFFAWLHADVGTLAKLTEIAWLTCIRGGE